MWIYSNPESYRNGWQIVSLEKLDTWDDAMQATFLDGAAYVVYPSEIETIV